MQRRRHPIVLADLEAQAFGDQAPRAPLSAGAALATADAAALVSTSTDTADVSTPALTSPPTRPGAFLLPAFGRSPHEVGAENIAELFEALSRSRGQRFSELGPSVFSL
ncbi:hypothetical protein MRB53_033089 [Persea americana]|uniref:Uncharacterized protein n=1 Tax=Persea americana TaxID=3435 RepID=A0ACC2KTP6_PERAE|nr:hypothetical protein MRB53_033089 [Persea americana]